ncbi:NAD-dependent succinate-semialdehyde dehydrogenase [Brachybacterium saurashtrense]|uniref:NAD-dependent succinate-semialdehyde dehydrogenase n=1 Tax=Brachybacterium saurashtrense TaxID=556288 RepID=A0A345YMC4_9MICO|nr:NAD-dependent succinate-semialdehyde dehydrogenase [Brachybacterium saurashtrense]AXK45076.1 NAD-dependent succinate-semialdehyde dehydrogenase [Brachybacterium saurashtrense]RRR21760.1 NAD-dependent succinate-semialdehyde dehydrogenase [Brachybacterium saurashtrense]
MTTLTAVDPTTGTVVREVPAATPVQIEEVLERARTAYLAWKETSFEERAEVLRAVATHLRENVEELAPVMTEEMGKPITEARGEVLKAAWAAEHYADHAAEYLAAQHIASDASASYVQHLPLGTVLGILPWNAPFWIASRFFSPALMAGNSCVMKHDPHVPGCASAIEGAFRAAGAPDGLFQALHAATEDVETVIRDPRIQAVSFTGSDRAGATVAAIAASEIKPAVLELGGSDPCLVLADADLEEAARVTALSRIINAGQSCIAAKRVIVERAVHDRFVELLAGHLRALTVGDPREETTQVGPIARKELRENLHRQVTASVEAGATLVMGGEMPEGPGWFYPVTLLTQVRAGMSACTEETFGPVAVVMAADDAEQAIAIANDTPYGLGSSIWTTAERGEQLARRIEAGQVSVNGIVKTDPRLPSGGIKRSGYGRELGPHGIREFVNAQQVWVGPAQG